MGPHPPAKLFSSFGITTRIVLPVVLLLVISNALVLSLTLASNKTQLLENANLELESTNDLQAQFFQVSVDELVADVKFLAGTPPLEGLIRAYENDGFDPDDNSSVEAWKRRLATIFTELMRAKPKAAQLRLIAADGRELVRVDRYGPNRSLRVVDEAQLQNKSDRDYFLAASRGSKGEVFLSSIDLNKELGTVIQPWEPTLRGAIPIFDSRGKLFGVIVKNVDLQSIFSTMASLADGGSLILANVQGDFLFHPDPSKTFAFEFKRRSNISDISPALAAWVANGEEADLAEVVQLEGNAQFFNIHRIHYGPDNGKDQLLIYNVREVLNILAPNRALRNSMLTYSLVIVLVAALLSWLVARKIIQPLSKMRKSLEQRQLELVAADLPLNAPGEIGDLARGFVDFSQALVRRRQSELREIAERKAAETTLRYRNEKLSAAYDELAQFAYIASHDLQEPLNTVRSFINLFHQYYDDSLDERAGMFLGYIDDSATRMSELIKALLDYSRLGKDATPETLDMNQLLGDVCRDLDSAIQSSHATVNIQPLPILTGLKTELRLLFQNLISNAIKFGREGVTPRVVISAERQQDGWLFAVSDNGIGIEAEYFDKVFLIFQRLHSRDKYPGSGIGLAHCRKIVETHGGKIWLTSEPGVGSTFHFTLREVENEKA